MGNKQTIFTEEQLDNYQVKPARRGPCSLPFCPFPRPRKSGLTEVQTLPLPSACRVTLGDFPSVRLSFPGPGM